MLQLLNSFFGMAKIVLFFCIFYYSLLEYGIITTVVNVSLQKIQNMISSNPKYFDFVVVNEFINNAYFYENSTYAYSVSFSKRTDFGKVIKDLYNETNDQYIDVYFTDSKPFTTYIFDIIFYVLFLVIAIRLFIWLKKSYLNSILEDHEFNPIVPDLNGIKFKDVIGNEEGKRDMMECVKYFQHRDKYLSTGFEIPKGLLLVGKPGTGKTLLAQAFANEAKVNFISVCGSDFMELYVGMGPKRVRELFETARTYSPCVIFIDEIDAIGSNRQKNHNHREQTNTLNKLLSEMDGFGTNDNIMIIAATNMVETLDSALIRSGRFDKHIFFDPPNIEERKEMFKLYAGKIQLDPAFKRTEELVEENFNKLARITAGLTGSDIKNICNQAVKSFMNRINIDSAEFKKHGVTYEDLAKSIDIIMIGMEKPERKMSEMEREIVSYHEAGHSLIAYMMEDTEPPIKVSIIPRGQSALGFSQQEPTDKKLSTLSELFSRICVLFGGRVAERIIYSHFSTGASDDIEKATKLAYGMVTIYGMADSIGPLNPTFNSDNISEHTKSKIDSEVMNLLKTAENRALELLSNHKEELQKVAKFLLEKEVLLSDDLNNLLEEYNIKNIA